MVQQTVYWAAYNARAVTGGHASKAQQNNESEEVDPRLFGASAEVVNMMASSLKECSSHFGRLEEAVER